LVLGYLDDTGKIPSEEIIKIIVKIIKKSRVSDSKVIEK
jgi:hypothetical protein